MHRTCKNCQTSLPTDANYCTKCGQSTKSTRQPFALFVKEALKELLDIDGRLSLTLKTLVTKPGLASYEYDQGMRAKYTPPLRLYLVISVIFFLLFSSFQQIFTGHTELSASSIDLYSRIMFVLFPMFALYIKVIYPGSYLVSNIVFSLHLHSVGYLILILIGPLEALERQHLTYLALQIPVLIYLLWYLLQAFKTMYRASWSVTAWKAALIFVIYMATLGLAFDVILPG
ncbi:DUF3667 domain-containing protein [Mangrovimicrobium sediminis]|uniref:DUF3667 domain-containing protein n=1 Tax=Mangrovimicrobium sediminis TaxID=2562682 RepID=A0A4Z0MA14_9GAMM|nr:DUF3667 domain-containing protein [Haliea sp. SAOS-164]TGD76237.1 DUF3667 domain-containing protein [Haliea sp. SAOS-164]